MAHTPHPNSLSVVDDLHDVAATLDTLRDKATGPESVALDYLAEAVRRSATQVAISAAPASRIHQHGGEASWQQ